MVSIKEPASLYKLRLSAEDNLFSTRMKKYHPFLYDEIAMKKFRIAKKYSIRKPLSIKNELVEQHNFAGWAKPGWKYLESPVWTQIWVKLERARPQFIFPNIFDLKTVM